MLLNETRDIYLIVKSQPEFCENGDH